MSITKLKRSLGLPLVALYGLGNILGAGIYVLVGKVAGFAGDGTILAFLMAMIVAAFTAFSYMELSSRYPVSASVSVYLHKAFKKQWLSVLVGLIMVGGGVASAAALAQGFAGYLQFFINVPTILASVGLLVILGLIAIKGINESAKVAALFTVLEVTGLLMVIWFGREAFNHIEITRLITVDPVLGVGGLVAGMFLAFYAFIGFEDMVNVAEEAKNPRRTMPLAILISLVVSTILYLLVAFVAITNVDANDLSASNAPLALVMEKSGDSHPLLLAFIGAIATMNGIIVQIIMGSRFLYGLAKQNWIHKLFATIHPTRKTPVVATVIVVGSMIAGTILLPLVSLAQITSLLVLIIFALVNTALIVIKRRGNKNRGYITVPMAVPAIGVLLCVATIVYQVLHWA